MASSWSIYLINFSGVNESGERFEEHQRSKRHFQSWFLSDLSWTRRKAEVWCRPTVRTDPDADANDDVDIVSVTVGSTVRGNRGPPATVGLRPRQPRTSCVCLRHRCLNEWRHRHRWRHRRPRTWSVLWQNTGHLVATFFCGGKDFFGGAKNKFGEGTS